MKIKPLFDKQSYNISLLLTLNIPEKYNIANPVQANVIIIINPVIRSNIHCFSYVFLLLLVILGVGFAIILR